MGLLALAQVADVNARDLGRRISLAGVAAVLGALAAVAALSDPHTGSRAERAVIAVDRSASVDAAMRSVEGRWIGRATPDGCVVPCRIVSFGARADALPPGPSGFGHEPCDRSRRRRCGGGRGRAPGRARGRPQ